MSYNIGQLRRNQIKTYSTSYPITEYGTDFPTVFDDGTVKFEAKDTYISTPFDLQKGQTYYLSFVTKSSYDFSIKLAGNNRTMMVKEFTNVIPGVFYEVVFTPNNEKYNKIVFEKTRKQPNDFYTSITLDTSKKDGVLINYTFCHLVDIFPSYLKGKYGLSYIKKMGLQGPPGLLFSMNGEEIRIGKSGIYEVEGININQLSFVIKNSSPIPYSDNLDYFIMDFQY